MPCTPSPCGANAVCREQNGAGSCTCLPEYFGDPYVGCRPECVMNSDCPRTRSCINSKCVDPCPGTCGGNSECHVVNHAPTCTCIAGYIGNPFTACTPQPESKTYLIQFIDLNLLNIHKLFFCCKIHQYAKNPSILANLHRVVQTAIVA